MSLSDSVGICMAVGINVRNLSIEDVYLLEGKILNDRELTQKALAFLSGAILPAGARLQVLKEMSPEERVALRERVTGVVPFRGSAQ